MIKNYGQRANTIRREMRPIPTELNRPPLRSRPDATNALSVNKSAKIHAQPPSIFVRLFGVGPSTNQRVAVSHSTWHSSRSSSLNSRGWALFHAERAQTVDKLTDSLYSTFTGVSLPSYSRINRIKLQNNVSADRD